jgi:hypothetical protein
MPFAAWIAALLFATLADTAPASTPPAPPVAGTVAPAAKDEKALALLRKMSDRLQGAKRFSFKARTSREVLVEGGAQATFFDDLRVAVQRPDKLAATRTGDLPEVRVAYDGRAMTAYAPGKGIWGTTAAPPTIDAMILAAYERAGFSFPADEMLVADPYAAMTKDLTSATLVGQTTVAGRKTDHLVLAGPGMEIQVWLDVKSGLPVMSALVYLDDPRKPHFSLEYLDWKIDPKFSASTFALPRPAGSEQVDLAAIAKAVQ